MNPGCPPDDELLAVATDEAAPAGLREHIEHCAECRLRLQRLSAEVAALRSVATPVDAANARTVIEEVRSDLLPAATTIGRYVVLGSLGSGGQADVYRVIDSDLGRFLVLKLSRRKSDDGAGRRDALLAEGRLLADLDHPGMVRIFDVGVHDGRPYLVLEHVPGRNLEQHFANNRPSVREAARLIAEVARAVAYAHHRGVVHGDITPKNILIDGAGRARLIDFGLSRIEDAWGENSGPPGGTPEFLPPEVVPATGRLGHSGPAGDVFGLGATLYWLLTGQAPFAAASIGESLARARRCDIDFEALQRARVPGRIARICRQSLAAEPARRPAPDVFASELERATRRWIRPSVVAAIVGIALAAAGLSVWLLQHRKTELAENAAVLHSSPTISVFRRDGVRRLSNELPLRTGDDIAVSCNIAPGAEAIILWFNGAGELKTYLPVRDVADKLDRLVYPAPHRSMSLEPPEGTDMIFFCRGNPIVGDDVRGCFPVGKSPPSLPAQNWLILQRSEVRIEGTLKAGISDELVKVEAIMKEIDRKLGRHFEGVTGIAFPHNAAAKTTK